MWSISATHPKTVSHSGLVTVFTKPHRSQTIIRTPCHRPFTGEIFGRPPFRSKSTPTRVPPSNLFSGGSLAGKYIPTRPHAPIFGPTLKFTRRRVRPCLYACLLQQVRLPPTSPSIHSTRPAFVGKALLFHFFSPATFSAFFCCLNLHCFCVF